MLDMDYWFEEGGRTVTIAGERYREVILRFHNDLVATLPKDQLHVVRFMWDGAPPHTAQNTRSCNHWPSAIASLPSKQTMNGRHH